MDVLEKALLVDELKTLIDGLNDNKTSLFEIAKSKQRIKDICASCDDPAFQDQLLPFKQFIQNEEFSAEELAEYGYVMTYRGTLTSWAVSRMPCSLRVTWAGPPYVRHSTGKSG